MTLLNVQTGERVEVVVTLGIGVARAAYEDQRSVGEAQLMRRGVRGSMDFWRKMLRIA